MVKIKTDGNKEKIQINLIVHIDRKTGRPQGNLIWQDRRKLTEKHKFWNEPELGTYSKHVGNKISSQIAKNNDQELTFEKVGRDPWREPIKKPELKNQNWKYFWPFLTITKNHLKN